MSTLKPDKFEMGARLSAERERLCLSAQEFADAAGFDRKTVFNTQSGGSWPNAQLLFWGAIKGMDIPYILTGLKSEQECIPYLEGMDGDIEMDDESPVGTLSQVLDVQEQLGLTFSPAQLKILFEYASNYPSSTEQLTEFVKMAWQLAGHNIEPVT